MASDKEKNQHICDLEEGCSRCLQMFKKASTCKCSWIDTMNCTNQNTSSNDNPVPNPNEAQTQKESDEEAQSQQQLWISSKTGRVVDPTNEQFNANEEILFKAPTLEAIPQTSNEILEYNKRCRDIIKEENNLINHRMSWFLQFQGFLFLSASGFVTKADPIFRIILALPGLLSGGSILMAVNDAENAIKLMETNMQTILMYSKENCDAITYFPISGPNRTAL